MKKVLLVLLTLLAFAATAMAADNSLWEKSSLNQIMKRGTLRVGLDPGYMPFEMKNKKGKVVGFDPDLAKVMAKQMGVKLELIPTAWDGIIPALMTDKLDIIIAGMTVNAERNLQINFADPYLIIGQTILISKKLEGKIKSYKDLNNSKYTITSKLGTTGDLASKRHIPKAKLNLFETENDAVMEVLNGKADAFIYDLPLCAIFYADNKDKLAFIDTPFTFEPLAFAIKKGDPDFMNWLNNFLSQVKGDGTYDKIYAKWFLSNKWLKNIQE